MAEQEKESPKHEEPPQLEPKDVLVETKHTIVIDGQEISYTVVCGTLVLKEESEKKGEKEGESEGQKRAHRSSLWLTPVMVLKIKRSDR